MVKWTSIHHDILVYESEIIQVERDGKLLEIQVPEEIAVKLLKLEEYPMAPRIPCIIHEMSEDGMLKASGVAMVGDRIISVNGSPTKFYSDFMGKTGGAN